MTIPKTFINTNPNNLTLAEIREKNYKNGYEMAIDDFAELLKKKRDSRYMKVNCDDLEIRKMTEQLKAGVDNEISGR